MDILELVGAEQIKADIPDFDPGDDVAVHFKVVEGDKQRVQIFRGMCIQKRATASTKPSPSARCRAEWASSGFFRPTRR